MNPLFSSAFYFSLVVLSGYFWTHGISLSFYSTSTTVTCNSIQAIPFRFAFPFPLFICFPDTILLFLFHSLLCPVSTHGILLRFVSFSCVPNRSGDQAGGGIHSNFWIIRELPPFFTIRYTKKQISGGWCFLLQLALFQPLDLMHIPHFWICANGFKFPRCPLPENIKYALTFPFKLIGSPSLIFHCRSAPVP